MTDNVEAKYAQMVKDADCPEGFGDWMKNQNYKYHNPPRLTLFAG